ncbi:uncharacterized protein A1O9_03668 [Exophiala aquamarina CBS 119918]|uniref:Alcohol dehydrogenase n=1 Tax=Exophiala aquamarina CBS 119918 TaxID=1182545 RepID=A0A072PTK7_9EURO|nr:uncharacterized protein A1O9_03668 [Exophiala aquamarina CBS 119918]KEF58825.1 hypothetical protein A1O9_03668 [Exophiala aquamarina CBS 119918]
MRFVPDQDIPDLSGRVVLVTGANIGLGRETVRQVAKHTPAHIFLAARTRSKAETTIEELKRENASAAPISFLELDLASFESIKKAASTFNSSSERLDLLINNAGIMCTPVGTTAEGYELQFGTNHVGHALLTRLLLPKLKQTATAHPEVDVRIVNVSSGGHMMAPTDVYPLADLKGELGIYSTLTRYGLSKLANIHFTQELARHNPAIKCVAIHPGLVNTNLTSGWLAFHPWFVHPINLVGWLIGQSVEKGVLNQLWAAFSPEAKSGAYYFPVGELRHDGKVDNHKAAQELWKWTEEQLEGQA